MSTRIERRLALTAAQLISSGISVEVTDTAAAPNVNKKRFTGAILQQAIQRVIQEQTLISANGAITIQSGTNVVTKGGVCAMTIAAPSAAQAGTRITITSNTGYAHTITVTAGVIQDGASAARTLATFAAFAGAGLTLEAYDQKWKVISNVGVTLTD